VEDVGASTRTPSSRSNCRRASQFGLDPRQPGDRRRDAEKQCAAGCAEAAGDHHHPATFYQNDVPPEENSQQSTDDHRKGEG